MTRIKYRAKPVWHETGLLDRQSGRSYVVAETPANLLIRLKGTRQVLSLPWNVVYLRAAQVFAAAKAEAKKTRRASVKRSSLVYGGGR